MIMSGITRRPGGRGRGNNSTVRCPLLFMLLLGIIAAAAVQLLILRSTYVNTASFNNDKESCIARISHLLTTEEKEDDKLYTVVCSSHPSIIDNFIQDRTKLQRLERKVYLQSLRSYRLSGLICNNHLDKSLPAVASEEAFKCLPTDYRRRACMDGRASYPQSCTSFRSSTTAYIPEPERLSNKQSSMKEDYGNNNYPEECKESALIGVTKCHESPMGVVGLSSVSEGQLALGIADAKVLTMTNTNRPVWRKEALDLHLSYIKEGRDVGPSHYVGSHKALQRAMDVVNVKGKSTGIFGSISPWVESILHYNGVKSPTMTVDYNQPISFDERMETESMISMLEGDRQFEVIVSYSSIEHDGQGRYGDPLDPDGDLAAMKEVWIKVSPGGCLILNVPIGLTDTFTWYSQRYYGPSRLPLLVRGWEYVGLATSKKVFGRNEAFDISDVGGDSPVMILCKPQSVGANDVLDTTKFGGLKCDVTTKKCQLQTS